MAFGEARCAPAADPGAPRRGRRTDHASGARIFTSPEDIILVQRGWISRSRLLQDGRRQIIELLLPGDLHEGPSAADPSAADALTAFGRCELCVVRAADPEASELREAIAAARPRRIALLEERVLSLGRRTAPQRMAHLFCELVVRLGATRAPVSCEMPMTQQDLADFLGLSVVHANRTCRFLREAGLADIRHRRLVIGDFADLAAFAEFSHDHLA